MRPWKTWKVRALLRHPNNLLHSAALIDHLKCQGYCLHLCSFKDLSALVAPQKENQLRVGVPQHRKSFLYEFVY